MDVIIRLDRWSIAVDGAQVHRLAFDWAVTFSIGPSDGPAFEIRIEQPFVLANPKNGEALVVPGGDSSALAQLLVLVRCPVTRADAFKDGHFELELAGGYSLSVPAAEDYEPWEVVGTDGSRLVSVPGGQVITWLGAQANG